MSPYRGVPSPEVTGQILPSSLTGVLPIALVFSTCLPVGFGAGTRNLPRRFSRGMASRTSLRRARHPVSGLLGDGFPYRPPYAVTPQDDHRLGSLIPRPAIGGNGRYVVQEYQPVVHRLRLSASA